MKSRNLYIIFAVLLLIYLGVTFFGDKKEGNFNNIITDFKTENVDKIVITPKENNKKKLELVKNGKEWTLKTDGNEYQTDKNSVENALTGLNEIKINSIISKNPKKWAKYEVEDDKCKRIQAFAGSKKVVDLLVGKFKFDPQTRTANSYVRLSGKDEVYSTDGFSGFNVPDNAAAYRIKTIAKFEPSQLKSIKLKSGDTEKDFTNRDGKWFENGVMIDSTKMANYLKSLSNMKGSKFVDTKNQFTGSSDDLTLGFDDKSINITAYPDTTDAKAFIIHSSANEKAFFDSDSTGIYKRIFGKLKEIAGM